MYAGVAGCRGRREGRGEVGWVGERRGGKGESDGGGREKMEEEGEEMGDRKGREKGEREREKKKKKRKRLPMSTIVVVLVNNSGGVSIGVGNDCGGLRWEKEEEERKGGNFFLGILKYVF